MLLDLIVITSPATWSRIENGVNDIKLSTIIKVAALLNISVVGQLISLGVNNSGNLTVQNNSEIQNFTNSGIASISGTLTSDGNFSKSRINTAVQFSGRSIYSYWFCYIL